MSMGISGIGSGSYYTQLTTGSRINSAADDPSGSAIKEKMEGQDRGYKAGSRNAEDGISVLNVADGALSGIADQLQQMRELAVQASNSATLSDDDRSAIQDQIDQIKQGISEIAGNTEFNTKKILDGSNTDMQIVSGANGQGRSINTGDATLQALGIADFDVTNGNFSIEDIDNALNQVNKTRSNIGSQTNALEYALNYNSQSSYNLNSSISTLADTDMAKTVSELKKNELFETIAFIMQKKQQENQAHKMTNFFM